MAREQIAPTKSNLIKVKERLATAIEGYDLLEQKREILVMELMQTVESVKILERDLYKKIETAYPALKKMLLVMGREKAERLSMNSRQRVELREKRVMIAGMNLPSLEVKLSDLELTYSPANSFAECDETVVEFYELLKTLTELAAVRTIAWRLAREVRKTQRRVNALEKQVIPTARETKAFIESSLEERERESFFSSKLLKRKAGKG
ncbi:MAG TPA: V-type ATP synthase subunit D [Treponema sp.]|jgi:V/A-type H+-transporting ATPase subunit D|uniref:V-type ATP synthase subunit D n=1 Tax=Gracilinema caldarium TaxID=215591 RepID=UPI0026ED280C|nr:V-type ATP synthase subunit D [Gracilinema caldarium]HON13022.1 V-type ATP synthase subunit D [Treponema sp.]HPC71611.1 V-type ATP synthase subunit D [Treponema sp.]HRS03601.1 V-type ATP synthase subunit D [Treponema sp.]HRU28321.1 V-type ATP synthase subunit D [Treponema sp.]